MFNLHFQVWTPAYGWVPLLGDVIKSPGNKAEDVIKKMAELAKLVPV